MLHGARRIASSRIMVSRARTIVREPLANGGGDVGAQLCGLPGWGPSPPMVARQPGHQADQERLERVLTLFVITSRHPVILQ